MECVNSIDLNALTLCPDNEDDLCRLATQMINILLIPRERLRKSDREKVDLLLLWGRRIVKFGSCLQVNQLNGLDFTEDFLKYEGINFQNILRHKNVEDSLILGKYIVISCIDNKLKNILLSQIFKNICEDPSEEVIHFLNEVWNLRDEICLEPQTVEELVVRYPFCIEQLLMTVVEQVISDCTSDGIETIMHSELAAFCVLCASSSKVFQMVLTILHEFLLLSNVHQDLLYFVSIFFDKVRLCSKKGMFEDLLPVEVRIFLIFLEINPFLYPKECVDSDFQKENVLNSLTHFICCNRRTGGALLSYFPEWIPQIYSFSEQYNILDLIPKKKDDFKSRECYLRFILQVNDQ